MTYIHTHLQVCIYVLIVRWEIKRAVKEGTCGLHYYVLHAFGKIRVEHKWFPLASSIKTNIMYVEREADTELTERSFSSFYSHHAILPLPYWVCPVVCFLPDIHTRSDIIITIIICNKTCTYSPLRYDARNVYEIFSPFLVNYPQGGGKSWSKNYLPTYVHICMYMCILCTGKKEELYRDLLLNLDHCRKDIMHKNNFYTIETPK